MSRAPTELTNALLRVLADGEYHSGASLGTQFGVSRAAIHHHVDKLAALGIDIFRVTGKGYRLSAPLQLLSADKMVPQLPVEQRTLPLRIRPVTPSTNDDIKSWLQQEPSLCPGAAVLAEMQTAGRGRRGRAWYSPYGSSLYLSLYWPLHEGFNAAIGLSIALGVGVAEMLQNAGVRDVNVKWPNDVYVSGRKIAGILVELEGQAGGEAQAIIGIGLNVHLPERSGQEIEQDFIDVATATGQQPNRNDWAAALLAKAREVLQCHEQHGLHPFLPLWPALDLYYQQPVTVHLGQHQQEGICQGIDELGALLVSQGGQVKRYFGGEISVRRAVN